MEIYKAILKDYCSLPEMNIINNPPKCYITDDNNITLTFNKNLLMDNINDHFARRPDIYLENTSEQKAYIIDVAIVNDKNIVKAYGSKLETYSTLSQKLRESKRLKYVYIYPVIITINGFINKVSVNKLNKLGLELNYVKMIRTIIIREMQDLTFTSVNES